MINIIIFRNLQTLSAPQINSHFIGAMRQIKICYLLLYKMGKEKCKKCETETKSENTKPESKDKKVEKHGKCREKMCYYLNVSDFVKSFIEIPTSNVSSKSTTLSSKYLAGRATVYNKRNHKVGICSASFLCMQNETGIFTDIANYLSIDNGLIITWFTPTTLINLELDSIVNGMVTECIVIASTKVGVNPCYGEKFNMIVSSDNGRIYFKLTKI
jgi:hypothetical protein